MRYLALGDSYTIGEGVGEEERFPALLVHALRQAGRDCAAPEIVARSGWTTSELTEGIERAAPQGVFDLVTLLIGVNNQYRGQDPSIYRLEFNDLLLRAIAFAGSCPGQVIVLSIPDWGAAPFAEGRDRGKIGRQIDRFNRINRALSQQAGVNYVEITSLSRKTESDQTWFAPDGLHPSAAQYRGWVEQILPRTLAIIE